VDNVLNEVGLELIWLGEESVYCLACPGFQFEFIYEYASPALKEDLRYRDESVRPSAVIELVDVNTLKVVATVRDSLVFPNK
jgi:hypothetical protein